MYTQSNPSRFQVPKKPNVIDDNLVDKQGYIYDLNMSFWDIFQLIQRAQVDANNGHDYLHLWELNVAWEIVPQTYHFHKLVN